MWWDLDPVQYELELMTVFNGTKALGQAAKERIRPRLSMRVTEQATTQPWSEYLSDYISEGCGTVVVIFGGLLVAVVLAIHWSAGHATFARLGAAALAMFIWVCGLICFFLRTLKALQWLDPAWDLIIAAISVLGIRSLPSGVSAWTTVGMRAGFVGIIVFASGFMLVRILTPFFRSIANRRHSSRHPEAAIVGGLLQLIAHLERLETLRQEREQLIHETLTRQKRRDDALRKLVEDEAQGKEPKEVKIKKFAVNTYLTDAYTFAVQQGDGSWKTVGRESTVVRRQDDDTFKESYNFGVQPKEGEWQVVMHEQRILPAFDLFREGDQWKGIRQQLARLVEELAWHIERGLPAKLSVGEQKLDTWLRQELRGRAETVRGWGRRVALPSKSSCEDLLAEVGVTVEHAAEEHWEAIPKSEWTRGEGLRHRVIRFARNVVVGVIPLLVVLVAPVLGFSIPLSVRDPLLTFAVPWILLQVLEFIVPNASGYLSRSKDIRELLSAPIAKAIA